MMTSNFNVKNEPMMIYGKVYNNCTGNTSPYDLTMEVVITADLKENYMDNKIVTKAIIEFRLPLLDYVKNNSLTTDNYLNYWGKLSDFINITSNDNIIKDELKYHEDYINNVEKKKERDICNKNTKKMYKIKAIAPNKLKNMNDDVVNSNKKYIKRFNEDFNNLTNIPSSLKDELNSIDKLYDSWNESFDKSYYISNDFTKINPKYDKYALIAIDKKNELLKFKNILGPILTVSYSELSSGKYNIINANDYNKDTPVVIEIPDDASLEEILTMFDSILGQNKVNKKEEYYNKNVKDLEKNLKAIFDNLNNPSDKCDCGHECEDCHKNSVYDYLNAEYPFKRLYDDIDDSSKNKFNIESFLNSNLFNEWR